MATSPGYTATSTGTDYWVAAYSGDSNNSPVTSGTALEPVSITPYSPSIITTPAADQRRGGQLDCRQGHGDGLQPHGHRDLHLIQQLDGQRYAAVYQSGGDAGKRRGHLAGLHRHVHGYGLLGGGLQRRQQQQLGHQRYGPGAREHHPLQPFDHHQPAAGQRRGGQLDC